MRSQYMKGFIHLPVRLLGELPWRRDQSKWSVYLSLYQLQNVFSLKVHFPGMKIETQDVETNFGFYVKQTHLQSTSQSVTFGQIGFLIPS